MTPSTGFRNLRSGLSFRLLLLTISFIMVVEVVVFVPSISKFRVDFLNQRLAAAQIAALSLTEAADGSISAELEQTLLKTAGVAGVVLDLGDQSLQILERSDMPRQIIARYDIAHDAPLKLIMDAFDTLLRGGDAVIEVRGEALDKAGISIAFLLDEAALFQAMLSYARNILILSIIISVVTGGLIYLSLVRIIVLPVLRVTDNIIAFREKPDDPSRKLVPSARRDEIGRAERELAQMQEDLRQALNQRRRLALLGQAVSKVNHDLRNILATAQLSSDRLRNVDDPKVAKASQRLITAIDRAINLCERTLKYGRADEPPPEKRPVELSALVDEVGASLTAGNQVDWVNGVTNGQTVHADPDHLFRMLLNIGRNSAQAVGEAGGGRIEVTAEGSDAGVDIRVADNGPGLPEKAKKNLFVPFASSSSKGGTGLGLTIVAELMAMHGGEATLEKSDADGATFKLSFPAG